MLDDVTLGSAYMIVLEKDMKVLKLKATSLMQSVP